ncbi:hypothetical protein [Mucilaginibacter sp. HD30]
METLKQSIYYAFTCCILLSAVSCKKDKQSNEPTFTCANCKTAPDAKAENNVISKGVYKGVVVGSTGTISIDVLNGGSTIAATLVLDGQTINLSSTAVWASGTPLTAGFTGTAGGQNYSFTFTVQANGTNPSTSSYTIPGHPTISFQLIKETSDNLIKCYLGTTEGKKNSGVLQSSVLNIITSGKTNTWFGLSKDNASGSISTSDGTISGNTINCNCGPTTTVTGTITSDQIDGTYKGSDNQGTFTAKRTL